MSASKQRKTTYNQQVLESKLSTFTPDWRCWPIVIVSKSRTSGHNQKSKVARSILFTFLHLAGGGGREAMLVGNLLD